MALVRCPQCGRVAEPPSCYACGHEWSETPAAPAAASAAEAARDIDFGFDLDPGSSPSGPRGDAPAAGPGYGGGWPPAGGGEEWSVGSPSGPAGVQGPDPVAQEGVLPLSDAMSEVGDVFGFDAPAAAPPPHDGGFADAGDLGLDVDIDPPGPPQPTPGFDVDMSSLGYPSHAGAGLPAQGGAPNPFPDPSADASFGGPPEGELDPFEVDFDAGFGAAPAPPPSAPPPPALGSFGFSAPEPAPPPVPPPDLMGLLDGSPVPSSGTGDPMATVAFQMDAIPAEAVADVVESGPPRPPPLPDDMDDDWSGFGGLGDAPSPGDPDATESFRAPPVPPPLPADPDATEEFRAPSLSGLPTSPNSGMGASGMGASGMGESGPGDSASFDVDIGSMMDVEVPAPPALDFGFDQGGPGAAAHDPGALDPFAPGGPASRAPTLMDAGIPTSVPDGSLADDDPLASLPAGLDDLPEPEPLPPALVDEPLIDEDFEAPPPPPPMPDFGLDDDSTEIPLSGPPAPLEDVELGAPPALDDDSVDFAFPEPAPLPDEPLDDLDDIPSLDDLENLSSGPSAAPHSAAANPTVRAPIAGATRGSVPESLAAPATKLAQVADLKFDDSGPLPGLPPYDPVEAKRLSSRLEKLAEEMENDGKIAEAAFLYEVQSFLEGLF